MIGPDPFEVRFGLFRLTVMCVSYITTSEPKHQEHHIK